MVAIHERLCRITSAIVLVAGCAGHKSDGAAPLAGSGTPAAEGGQSGAAVAGRGVAGRSAGTGATGVVETPPLNRPAGAGAGAAGQAQAAAGASAAGNGAGAAGHAGQGAAGSGGALASCTEPPVASELVGWAAVAGMDITTTTGGGDAAPQTVSTLAALQAAVSGDTPAVVYVKGVLDAGSLRIGANKTIVGLCGAELHGHVDINGSANMILRNLAIVGYGVGNCALDPKYDAAVGCSSGADAMSVQHAHHVWVDHCDISDGTDGNLDITNGADFVTVSWTKFHYSPRTDSSGNDSTGAAGHRFSNLIGGADGVAIDVGHLNVTWHHDWWADNVNQRMPRTRAGKIHVFNNLFTASGNSYCTNAGDQATLLVEANVYQGVANPLQPDSNGDMRAKDNLFMNTSGTTTASGMGFTPSYGYRADAAADVRSAVESGAGPH